MNAAVYVRVSTGRQDETNQIPAIEAYASREGLVISEVYAEQGSAWTSGHQPELARLLRELRTGRRRYDYLLILATDRLTRGGIVPLLTLLRSFEEQGCRVVSITEPLIGTDNALRDVFAAFLAWAAKYESDRRSVNTKLGQDKARAKGHKIGRPKGRKDSKPRLKKRPVVFRHERPSVQPSVE